MLRVEVLHEFQPAYERGSPLETSGQPSWAVTRDPSTGSHDELCITGTKVEWYQGLHPHTRTVKKTFSFETEILQAFWCEFEGGLSEEKDADATSSLKCVCVRENGWLSLFLETGAVHYVPLPFVVRHAWPIKGGILIERQVSPEWGSDGLPILYSLLHPMDDLCPITFRRPTATTADITVLGFFTDPQVRVIHTATNPHLIICYDSAARRHSVWAMKPAKREDIPPHLNTPRPSNSSTATPSHPLSTSAPGRYSQFTPLVPMDTPIEMILSSRKPLPVMESVKLPILAQIQWVSPYCQLGSGLKSGGGSGLKMGSGRSPFISRLQAPATQMKKRSKSLSPPLLARISPFSQTVNSRSWSTFYSEESFGDSFEPLLPQVCLHLLWQEWEEGEPRSASGMASSAFTTTDVTGTTYLALVVTSSSQLWLLQFTSVEAGSLSFGALTSIPAVQAIPLSKLAMMVVLCPDGELLLYSGCTKVAAIDVSALIQDVSLLPGSGTTMEGAAAVTGVRDPIEESFTVVLDSGRMARCSLPPVYRHPVVALCLRALSLLLPTDTSRDLLSALFTASFSLPFSNLLPHFSKWLLACLGLGREEAGGEKTERELSPWQHVQGMVDGRLLRGVPALQLFYSGPLETSPGDIPSQPSPSTQPTVSLQSHAYTVAFALHLVYEELKLNTAFHNHLSEMASLLHRITSHLGWMAYVDLYQRDFPTLFLQTYPAASEKVAAQFSEECMAEQPSYVSSSPPQILHWLYQKLRNKPTQPFPVLPGVCKNTAQVVKLYGLYTLPKGSRQELDSLVEVIGSHESLSPESFVELQIKSSSPDERVILCLVQEGVQSSNLETLPVGVCLPLWDCIIHCQQNPPSSWPQAAYDIIGRTDVVKSLSLDSSTFSLKIESPEDTEDGMNIDEEILHLRFPNDLRVNEVRRLLQSSKPVRIALTQKPEVSDHEFIEQQETHLLAVCQRTMALPVGRGMFSVSTAQPLPTAPHAIPPLNLTGRAPPRNATVGLDHVEKPARMVEWAEFHNGVAAGLRIAPGISKLDSTWIVFNHPSGEEQANTYAGFLMALGLQGHLTTLSDFHLYDYLQEKHELTVIGLLLGVTAGRVGSMSSSLASLLSLYLPPLLPLGSADMEVSHGMQTAALVGMGLLFLGSGNRHLVEVMLREIGRLPGPELEFAEDRESYSLTAGLALGMITLGQGGNLVGLSDLSLVDQLCVYMNGGPKEEVAMSVASGPSHLVLEGDQVNTHVTAPGAIIALGLMYLKTNDSSIAVKLDAPKTHYELDCIQPDFLLLKALSRGLIMWDAVEPTQEWIDDHIPEIVHKYAFQGSKAEESDGPAIDYQTLSQACVNITAGCCLAMGLRFAGTRDQKAYQCLLHNVRGLLSRIDSPAGEQAGKPCLESCLSATLLALAVIMSGSGDLEVLRLVHRLHTRITQPEVHYGNHMAAHMALGLLFLGGGRFSLSRSNMAIMALLCSLFPRFPNSSTDNRYHLQALRHLYVLAAEPRVLVTRDVRTDKACSVNVCIRTGGEEMNERTPCIIPAWNSVEKIEVCSSRYWPVKLELSQRDSRVRQVLSRSGTVFVKQRAGYLHQKQDSDKGTTAEAGPSVLSSQYYGISNIKGMLPAEELSGDPLVRTFCAHVSQLSRENSHWSRFCSAVLLECISQEKLQVLTTYLHLEQLMAQLAQFPDITQLWQVKLAEVVCSESGWGCPLLSHQFTASLQLRLKNFVESAAQDWLHESSLDDLLRWYLLTDHRGSKRQLSKKEALLLALTLLLCDIPSPHLLQLTSQTTVPDLYITLNSLHVPVTAVVRLMPVVQPEPQ